MNIFCDLDGVLVAFSKGVCKAAGMDISVMSDHDCEEVISKWGSNQLWKTVGRHGDNFWTDLGWTTDGKVLWNAIKVFNPTILTGRSMDKRCEPEKRVWCARELGDTVPVTVCLAKEKQLYAGQDSLLIDDKEKNCHQWASAGGAFIHHKNTLDTLEQLRIFGFDV